MQLREKLQGLGRLVAGNDGSTVPDDIGLQTGLRHPEESFRASALLLVLPVGNPEIWLEAIDEATRILQRSGWQADHDEAKGTLRFGGKPLTN